MSAITALSTNYQQPPSGKDDSDPNSHSGKAAGQALDNSSASADDSVQLSPLVMDSLITLHEFEESNLTEYELLLSRLATSLKSASHAAYLDAYPTTVSSAYI